MYKIRYTGRNDNYYHNKSLLFYICDDILAHGNKRFKDFRGGFQKMAKANFDQWEGFGGHLWKEEVNVRDFIQHNYTQYDGDESFLAGPTEATNKLWGELSETAERGAC